MAINADLPIARFQDGILNVDVEPSVAIGGWTIQFKVTGRHGFMSGAKILKSVASGYNDSSGINVTNSGNGQFQVRIFGSETSGLNYGAYAMQVERIDSGSQTVLVQGYLQVKP